MDEAWEDLLRLIEHREMTSAELERRLRQRGHTARAAQAAVRKARRLGLIDEVRLAQAIVEAESEGAQRGLLRVQADLDRRGVAERTADHVLAGVDDLVRCRAAAVRFIQRHGRPANPGQWRRLAGWLARRGHLEESVQGVLEELGIGWTQE